MTARQTKRNEREHRDRLYLSCRHFGTLLGDMGERELYALDGKVYAIGSHRAEDLGDYLLFRVAVREGWHPDFVRRTS